MNKEDTTLSEASRKLPKSKSRRRQPAGRRAEPKQATMKAIAFDRFGPPSVLKLRTLPMPKPGPGEVLIGLHAAGVGSWDGEIRGGWWPAGRPPFPVVPGSDGAGIVVARGERARRFKLGDKVWACEFINPKGGFYAEFVAVNAEHAARVPKPLNLEQAGAAMVTGLTALQGIDDKLHVRKGETVLIFGASGAVGTLAVQFAKWRGARVLATASGKAAGTLLKKLGTKAVVDARSKNFIQQLRKFAPDGLDAVLALAGGRALEQALELVRPGGRVAYPNGVEPEPRRRAKSRLMAYNGNGGRREFERLGRAVSGCRLRVPIAAVHPLAKAAKAHERLKKGGVTGRIVLRIIR